MGNRVKKFTKFVNEKIDDIDSYDDIDPYSEENWTEKGVDKTGRTKNDLIQECILDVLSNSYGYRQIIRESLSSYFNNLSMNELKEFLGESGEECPNCQGTGEIENNYCHACLGRGVID